MVSIGSLLPASASSVGHEFPAANLSYPVSSDVTTTIFSPATLASVFSGTSPSAVAIMTAAASAIAANPDDHARPGAENGECQLLGPFALIIQAALGALALLSLVYKRWRERPQRPVKVWAFDASKQVVGSMLLHIANLLMSMLSSGQLKVTLTAAGDYEANPCSFYLLNLAIDTTLGIPILIMLLRLLTYAFSLTPLGDPPESIESGNYGRPPKATWWLKQSFIYFIGLLGMKICVFIAFQLCPWIVQVGDWALKWTEGNEMVQVFFVMLFFPVVMNALQYYIIDSFIKNQKPADHEPIPSEDEDDDIDQHRTFRRRRSQTQHRDSHEPLNRDTDDEIRKGMGTTTAKEVDDGTSGSSTSRKVNVDPKTLHEYDPATDGERNVGNSSGEQEDLSEALIDTMKDGKR